MHPYLKNLFLPLFTFLLLAPPLRAQGNTRFSKNIKVEKELLQIKVSKNKGSWRVALLRKKGAQSDSKKNRVLLDAAIPEWISANYYDYTIVSKDIEEHPIIIFEARPLPGLDTPKNAETLQFVWIKKNDTWKTIATTQSSILEGRDHIQFRRRSAKKGKGNTLELIRIQSKDNAIFCGNSLSVYQTFDTEDSTFHNRLRLPSLEKDVVRLDAKLSPTHFLPSNFPGFVRWAFASSKASKENANTVIRPNKIGDGSTQTFWSEGRKDSGRGEFVTARLNDALKISGVRIFPGAGASPLDFQTKLYPKTLLISLSEGTRFLVNLPTYSLEELQKSGGLVFTFPKPIRSSCLTAVLFDKDLADGETAITELSPISELHGLTKKRAAEVVVRKLLASKNPRTNHKLAQLSYPLRFELVEILSKVLKEGTNKDKRQVIPLLRNLPSATSLPILIQLFERTDTKDASYSLLKPLLSSNAKSGPELIKLYKNGHIKSEKKRLDLIRLLGRIKGPSGARALIDSLGEGDLRTRQERMRAIARGGKNVLGDLFNAAHRSQNTTKGEDALGAIHKISKRAFRNQRSKKVYKSIKEIYENAKTRRLKVLSASVASFYVFDGDYELYKTMLDNSDPFIRKIGVAALAPISGQDARALLERALSDPSPDVRIQAIKAFSRRSDVRQSQAKIINFVKKEKWIEGVRPACKALSKMEGTPAMKALSLLISKNDQSAIVASKALIKAKKALKVDKITVLLKNPKTHIRLIFSLLEMLGVHSTQANEGVLKNIIEGDLLAQKRFDERTRFKIRKRAILALGKQKNPSAADFLFTMLENEANGSKIQEIVLRAFAFQSTERVLRRLLTFEERISQTTQGIYRNSILFIKRRINLAKLSDAVDRKIDH